MTVTLPPAPRRIGRPRWLDLRVIGGVLLLVASIAIGAKVIGAASRTSPVWSLAHDLSAGTTLVAADLVAAEVNLAEGAAAYLGTAELPLGKVTNRDLSAGELLPAAALREQGDGRLVSLPVPAERMAPDVTHGSLIDLYLVTGRSGVTSTVETELLAEALTVQSVAAPASGGLSGAVSSRYQVALLLTPEQATQLIPQFALGEAMVVARISALDGGR